MSGIFGIFNRDGSPVAQSMLEAMTCAMAGWQSDTSSTCLDGQMGLGLLRLFTTQEHLCERLPLINKTHGLVFTACGRVDNRDELIRQLQLEPKSSPADGDQTATSNQQTAIGDGELMLHAYLKWGEGAPVRIYGDWAFAVWNSKERKLFLARDHCGYTPIYYYLDQRVFAYASSHKALLALNLAPVEMHELYLAQMLASWPAYRGERTYHRQLKRLPHAHCLTVTPDNMKVHEYWRLLDTPELHLPHRSDYVETFRELFDEAVRCRLRTNGKIAFSLSGGLDSGSVLSTASHLMGDTRERLLAFTSAPLFDTENYVGTRFGNELPLAAATAQHAGNIKLYPVTAATLTPIQAIRNMLLIRNQPCHSAGNTFWGLELLREVSSHGCRILFNGAKGNLGISWKGSAFSQSLRFQLGYFGWKQWAKEAAKQYAPKLLLKTYRKMQGSRNESWNSSAINPDFAMRLKLPDLMSEAMYSQMSLTMRNPVAFRNNILRPGSPADGSQITTTYAAFGLQVRDPTADARLLAFALSVPDHIYIDPKTGLNRWLIREAMKGRLPDEVRLNRNMGTQAGDLVPRLRACAGEVETALNELASGPAAAYLNVPYMHQVWSMVQTDDTQEAFRKSVTVLTRGIMAGLWVNDFYDAS
jgi:asparagine synthase (glutamine-hydrolysing)